MKILSIRKFQIVKRKLSVIGAISLIMAMLVSCQCGSDGTAPKEPDREASVGFLSTELSYIEDDVAGMITLVVGLTVPIDAPLNFLVHTTDLSAQAGLDYEAQSEYPIFIPAGNTETVIQIPIMDDNLDEENENFRVEFLGTLPQGVLLDVNVATVTIIDDDEITVGFTNLALTYEEGDTDLEYTVTVMLSMPFDDDLVLRVFSVEDLPLSAGSDMDYTAIVDREIFISEGTTTVEFPLVIKGDEEVEGDETFNLILSTPSGTLPEGEFVNNPATVTIQDDEMKVISFEEAEYLVDEIAGIVTLTVNISEPIGSEVTIAVFTDDGTAQAEQDYVTLSLHTVYISIPGDATTVSLNVSILPDDQVELDETFTVTLTPDASSPLPRDVIIRDETTTVTIVDNDMATVRFTSLSETVVEGDGHLDLIVMLDKRLPEPLTLDLTYAAGTPAAREVEDYTSVVSVTIPKGTLEASLSIPIIDDLNPEADERFTVTINDLSFPPDTLTARKVAIDEVMKSVEVIIDNDDNTVGFTADSLTYEEEGNSDIMVMVTVEFFGDPLRQPLNLKVSTMDDALSTHPAMAGSDYTALADQLISIAPASTEVTFNLIIKGDDTAEYPETFKLMLSPVDPLPTEVRIVNNPTLVTIIDDDDKIISFSDPTYTFDEGIGNAVLTVTVSQDPGEPLELIVTTVAGTAAEGSDYTSPPTPFVIASSGMRFDLLIPINDDRLLENEETFQVTLELPTGGADNVILGSPSTALVTIEDNDMAEVNFRAVSWTVVENEFVILTVELNRKLLHDLTLALDYSEGIPPATRGADYTGPDAVVIPANVLHSEVTININDDGNLEDDEKFMVTIANPSFPPSSGLPGDKVNIGAKGTAMITITDPMVVVGFTQNRWTYDENAGTAMIEVELDTASITGDITLAVSVDDDTTEKGEDYTSPLGTLTIPKGERQGTVAITITDDNILEVDETFTVGISVMTAPRGTRVTVDPDRATVTITDNDTATVTLTRNPAAGNFNEGDTVTLTATFEGGSTISEDLTLNLGFTGSASPMDYTVPATIVIPANASSGIVIMSIVDDHIVEDEERILVTSLPHAAGSVDISKVTTVGIVNIPITDIDTATIQFVNNIMVNEGIGIATLTIELDNPVDNLILINLDTIDGTAINIEDYNFPNRFDSIPLGTRSKFIQVNIIDDSLSEPNESFTIALTTISILSPISSRILLGTKTNATVTIIDNESASPLPSITAFLDTGSFTIAEDGGTLNVPVSLSEALPSGASLVLTVTATANTASQVDYGSFTSGDITISSGRSGSISIPITDDDIIENEETFIVELSVKTAPLSSLATVSIGSPSTATVTITDDDMAKLGFTSTIATIGEGDGQVNLMVSVDQAVDADIKFIVSTANGLAIAPADYTAVSLGEYIIPASSTTPVMVPILISDDTLDEPSEDFTVTIASVTPVDVADSWVTSRVTVDSTKQTTTVTITDDDVPPPPIPSITAFLDTGSFTIAEDGGTLNVPVSLSEALPSGASLVLTVTTTANTASEVDYGSFTSGDITISSGRSGSISIPITDDDVIENEETFIVELSMKNPPLASLATVSIGSPSTATVTITDDDMAKLGFTSTIATIGEGDGQVNLMVSVDQAVDADIKFIVSTANGLAIAPADYTAVSLGEYIIPASSTTPVMVPILISDDTLDEPSEDFTVTIASVTPVDVADSWVTSRVTVDSTKQTTTVTITDDDVPPPPIPSITAFLDTGSFTIAEDGGTLNVPVSLSEALPSGASLVLTVTTTANTASQVDYGSFTSGDITISSGRSGSISIPITDDDVIENEETFIVELSVKTAPLASLATVSIGSPSTATVTITDDDMAKLGFTSTIATIGEGDGQVNLMVSVDQAVDADIKFIVSTANGSAIAPADYTAVSLGEYIIPASSTTPVMVPILISDDTLDEPSEDFTVTIASVTPVDVADSWVTSRVTVDSTKQTTTVTITDDDVPPPPIPSITAFLDTGSFTIAEDGGDAQCPGLSQ